MNTVLKTKAVMLCILLLSGCASIKLMTALSTNGYAGKWLTVDNSRTNAPSGAHLYQLMLNESRHIQLLDAEYGAPDYVKHTDSGGSGVSLVYRANNLFVTTDWISGNTEEKPLDNTSEYMLPPQYLEARQQEQQARVMAVQKARKEAAEKERIALEAKETAQREAVAAQKEAAAAQALKEKEARKKEDAKASEAFDLDMLKKRADSQKGKTIVFKNFYIGMPIADCLQLINNSMGLQQTLPTPIIDKSAMSEAKDGANPEAALSAAMVQALGSQMQGMTPAQLRAQGFDDETIATMGFTDPTTPYRVYSRKGKQFVAKNSQDKPFAVADESGSVISVQLSRQILNKLFDAAGMPTEEFLQSFINAYGISGLEPDRQKITATILGTTKEIGFQNVYRHRNSKGYEVMYYADSVILDDDMKTFADTPPEGTMTIKKIETAKERETKFD